MGLLRPSLKRWGCLSAFALMLCGSLQSIRADDSTMRERTGKGAARKARRPRNLSKREVEALVLAPLGEQLKPCELGQVTVYGGTRVPRGSLSVTLPRRPALRSGRVSLILQIGGDGAGVRLPVSAELQCPAPAVQAGDRVQLAVHRGAVRVTAPGRAFQTGHVGEVIQVENTATRSRLSGTVVSEHRVEVLP